MATLPLDYLTPDLDFLLEAIVESLQLTREQYQDAVTRYERIGKWLDAPDSSLRRYSPILIFPQGSMALQTTVRPIKQMEYDLDLVCQMQTTTLPPMQFYEELHKRLDAHEDFSKRLERLKRCVRLNYAGAFHLDVIPAEPDPARPDPCVRVPDRALKAWTPSNPRGFAGWFKQQERRLVVLEKRVVPVPTQTPASEKSVLATVVQVMKRRRDIDFGDSGLAPRSIWLTTLAGTFYGGEDSVVLALDRILGAIVGAMRAVAPKRLEIVNPTNRDERFSDSFTAECYAAFRSSIESFHQEVQALLAFAGGQSNLHSKLSRMFGDVPATQAFGQLEKRLTERRASGLLYGPTSGLAIVSNRPDTTRPVRSNTFHGDLS